MITGSESQRWQPKVLMQQLNCQACFLWEGCEIHYVYQASMCLLLLSALLKGLFFFFFSYSLFLFQGHGSHRHLLGSAPEQDPDQRPGNAVPNATDARQNGSGLTDSDKEKGKKEAKRLSFHMEKNKNK